MLADPPRSRCLLLASMLVACDPPPTKTVEQPPTTPNTPHVYPREHLHPITPEPATAPLRIDTAPLVIDDHAGPLLTPSGRWTPGTGADVLFTEAFIHIDDEAYWVQPDHDAGLLRIPRGRDHRWIRDDFECPGWLVGARDDLLWCADVHDDTIEITVVDKTHPGPATPAAALPWPESMASSLHPRLDRQGPVIVGDHAVIATPTGFAITELEGNGTVEQIELGHRPRCAVARGRRLAWLVHPNDAVFSGELPLSAIHREYASEASLGCPAWAGDSLLVVELGDIFTLLRLTANGRVFKLEEAPRGAHALVGDSDRAWWLVRDSGLWWIDATGHGRVDASDVVPYAMTADDGLLSWKTVEHGRHAIHAGDVFGGSPISR